MPSSYTSSFPSTPSLVSVNTTTSTSSTTPLRPTSSSSTPSSASSSSSSSPQAMQKDYSKSFGLLQAQYGWGPMTSVPTHVRSKEDSETKKNRRKDRDTRSSSVRREQEVEQGSNSRPGKDYESVFGSMSSRYGFGGSWPTPSKKSKEHRS
ncbi:hypothetical protein GSI_11728 [Ganoderma sinense ZZ0214-1]|uniref:Uncharacterized protein n=1 Tax=Ganoderma sinense ZZ0214-1 TaxID=1077348 RepID=A0A2G8RWW4_9APHY|nr:hypothetical protein GSI_11728 [Ganoderma sinense ZZ0214-1]